jgi:hypothetical protein
LYESMPMEGVTMAGTGAMQESALENPIELSRV